MSEEIVCLGIESTAHTLSVGITIGRKIVANVSRVFVPGRGGIKPQEAAEHHYSEVQDAIEEALSESGVNLREIKLIAYSAGPGMPPCLQVAAVAARALALALGVAIVGVNHCLAHVEIARTICGAEDPIVVYVSGGNTQIIGYKKDRYVVFGETEDIGLGNAQDKLARLLGAPQPYGPWMDKQEGKWIGLPYTVKGMDLAFSGIVTEAFKRFKEGAKIEDVCYSFQEVCFSMLTEVAERALAHTRKKDLVLTGGVAASRRLREKMRIMCEERGVRFHTIPAEYARDNGAMIALTGFLAYKYAGWKWSVNEKIKPKWRIDSFKWPLIPVC